LLYRVDNRIHVYSTSTAPFRASAEVLANYRTWNSVEPLQSADLLLRACDFSCYRKEIAVTSSVLILRFLHGFYPGEICALLKARRKAVDKWILRGRNEVKQHLASPYPLSDAGRLSTRSRFPNPLVPIFVISVSIC
jgi:hypothetical protein